MVRARGLVLTFDEKWGLNRCYVESAQQQSPQIAKMKEMQSGDLSMALAEAFPVVGPGVPASEYSRWLIQRDKFELGENERQHAQFASQELEYREVKRSAELGQKRVDTHNQRSAYKERMDSRRQHKSDTVKQMQAQYLAAQERAGKDHKKWLTEKKLSREAVQVAAARTKAESRTLLEVRREQGEAWRKKNRDLTGMHEKLQAQHLAEKKQKASKNRRDTKANISSGQSFSFTKRRSSVLAIQHDRSTLWAFDKNSFKDSFSQKLKEMKHKSKTTEMEGIKSRQDLAHRKYDEAAEMRRQRHYRQGEMSVHKQQQEEYRRQAVVTGREMAQVHNQAATQMLFHPHYQSMIAVRGDVTSSLSMSIIAARSPSVSRTTSPGTSPDTSPDTSPAHTPQKLRAGQMRAGQISPEASVSSSSSSSDGSDRSRGGGDVVPVGAKENGGMAAGVAGGNAADGSDSWGWLWGSTNSRVEESTNASTEANSWFRLW